MQSKQFESYRGSARLDSFDQEFVHGDDQFAPDEYEESRAKPAQRRLAPLWLLLGSALAGVVLALIWRNVEPKRLFSIAPTETASTASTVGAPGLVQDLETMKKIVAELRDTQQKLEAKITALDLAQRHIQQELSAQSAGRWYSESKMLMYRTATAQQPKTSSSTKPTPTP